MICIDNGEFRGVNCILRMQCINRFNKYKQHDIFFLLCIKNSDYFHPEIPSEPAVYKHCFCQCYACWISSFHLPVQTACPLTFYRDWTADIWPPGGSPPGGRWRIVEWEAGPLYRSSTPESARRNWSWSVEPPLSENFQQKLKTKYFPVNIEFKYFAKHAV